MLLIFFLFFSFFNYNKFEIFFYSMMITLINCSSTNTNFNFGSFFILHFLVFSSEDHSLTKRFEKSYIRPRRMDAKPWRFNSYLQENAWVLSSPWTSMCLWRIHQGISYSCQVLAHFFFAIPSFPLFLLFFIVFICLSFYLSGSIKEINRSVT